MAVFRARAVERVCGFIVPMASIERHVEHTEDSPGRSNEANLKEIFDLCDRDRDGYITAQDFRSIGKEHFGNTQV